MSVSEYPYFSENSYFGLQYSFRAFGLLKQNLEHLLERQE